MQSLASLRVLVTRAVHQSAEFTDHLRALGAEVIEIPMVQIGPVDDLQQLDEAIQNIARYNWVLLASSNAVDEFFKRAQQLNCLPIPSHVALGVMGPATAKTVEKYGHRAQYHPDRFVAEAFIKQFPGYPHLYGQRMLWPRSDTGRGLIKDELARAGATVDDPPCYRSGLPDNRDTIASNLALNLRDRRVNVITVASPQTTKNMLALAKSVLSKEEIHDLLLNLPIVTIGPETSGAAHALGFKNVHQAQTFMAEGMIAALTEVASGRP
jgi:uroporphyrinogen-III synthase